MKDHSQGVGNPATVLQGLVLALLTFVACVPTWAQSNTGRILGTVSDATGAAVAGAMVIITDVQRGANRRLTTDGVGEYVAPDLVPGVYKVRVEAQGFKTSERLSIGIEVAKDAQIDFSLQP